MNIQKMALGLMLIVSACAKRMTVQEYVLWKMPLSEPGFSSAIEAADEAQKAFHLNADTPIREMHEGSEVFLQSAENFSRARDAYRKAMSYRLEGHASVLQPLKDHVTLTDVDGPQSRKIPIPGTEVSFRVQANRLRVDLVSVESSRGLPVLRFDAGLRPRVAREFHTYMVGDRVEVSGDVWQNIRRPTPMP